ncbi:MAG: hypothetical protein HY659_03410 [Rhizobiales bacterium]|nr:hypothetical protein [Hyphomicrobiales bacterium]
MKKTFTALAAAAALGAATVAAPTPASAHVWWFWPAIIGGAVVGTGAVVVASQPYAYGGTVTVRPSCYLQNQLINGAWQQVRVCP